MVETMEGSRVTRLCGGCGTWMASFRANQEVTVHACVNAECEEPRILRVVRKLDVLREIPNRKWLYQ